MTKYLRQRIKGILTQEQLVDIRSQAKVHVWDAKIDDILNAEKTTDGKSLRYEGGKSRYQNDKVKNYLISLLGYQKPLKMDPFQSLIC